MPQYDAGSAGIKIKPNFRNFVTETETELKRYDFSMDVRVGADTSVAATEIANLQRTAQESQTFRMGADTRVAASEIENLQRVARENQTFRVDANTAAAEAKLAALKRGGTIPLTPEMSGNASQNAQNAVRSLTRRLRSAAVINVSVLGVVGAAGVIAELAAVANAIAQVSKTAALIPAITIGGLAGIGAAVTGMSGIPAAFKAITSASKETGSAAASQADHFEDLAEKQYQVEQASKDVRSAQRNLNDAYKDGSRAIRDMNFDLEDQVLSVEDASISVEEAAARLNEVQFDPTADSTTRRRAQNSYDQAVLRLRQQQVATQDLQQDTAEANAVGVEGSDQVVAARERVEDAIHSEQRALADLLKEQASGGSSAGQDKVAQAMEKLSPQAQKLVNDIRSIGPSWTDARKAGQDALTDGLGPAIVTLADKQLPNLRDGFVGINGAFNTGLKASLLSLSSEKNVLDFRETLTNTTTGFRNAARGAGPLTDALTKMATVGSQFLPGFGTAIGNAADRFNTFTQRAAADGSLKKWMREGIDATKNLFSILGNLGSSIASIFHAADTGDTLERIDEITERWRDFLKSTQGQSKLGDYFAEAREAMDRIEPLLENLPELLRGVWEGFQTWAAIAGPFLRVIADLLAAHPELVTAAVVAYLGFRTLGPIFTGMRTGMNRVNTEVGNLQNRAGGAVTSLRNIANATGGVANVAGVGATNLGRFGSAIQQAGTHSPAIARMQQAYMNAAAGASTFGRTAGTAAAAVSGVRSAVAGASAALGGPWVIAIIAATLGLAKFTADAREHKARIDAVSASWKDLVISRDEMTRSLAASNGAVDDSSIAGMTTQVQQLNAAIESSANNRTKWSEWRSLTQAPWNDNISKENNIADQYKAAQEAIEKLGVSEQTIAKALVDDGAWTDLKAQLEGMGQGGRFAAENYQWLRDEMVRARDVARDTTPGFTDLTEAVKTLADTSATAGDRLDAMKTALDILAGKPLEAQEALAKYNDQVRETARAAAEFAEGDGFGTALVDGERINTTTANGRKLFNALNDIRDATLNAAIAGNELDPILARNQDQFAQLASATGLSVEQITELATGLGYLPDDIKILASLQGATDVRQQLVVIGQLLDKNREGVTIPAKALTAEARAELEKLGVSIDTVNGKPDEIHLVARTDEARRALDDIATRPLTAKMNVEVQGVTFDGTYFKPQAFRPVPQRAAGGQLPTTGPGTERRDGFLGMAAATGTPISWLDGGEWIVNRDSSQVYGRELAAINAGTFPRHADGGVIGGSSSSTIQALESYARSKAGTAYGGINDCSGLISQLANVAAGLAPMSGRMATGNEGEWLSALGWSIGKGAAGAFRVGWINDPNMPAGGHTAGTLPSGVNVESNGSQGVLYGGSAAGYAHPMFNQWAYLQMQATGATTPGVGGIGTGDTSSVTSQSVLSPQAQLPGRRSDTELQRIQGEAAVDAANSERNRVYADPNATDQDRLAADAKYQQAQNSLESSQKSKDDDATPPNLQGIFSKAGSILATGLLSGLGLENSILSENNVYNKALSTAVNFYDQKNKNGQLAQPSYAYTPKNLPSVVTTTTPQSSTPVTDPALADQAPAAADESSTGSGPVDAVKKAMSTVGWNTGAQWSALDQLVSNESSWNPTAQNPTSTAYGLFQFLDQTWATVGGSKTSDPYLQGVYGQKYISQRYGTPAAAWSFWQSQNPHWYDQGGEASGIGLIAKNIMRPERVLSPSNTETFNSALPLLESINASAWSPDRINAGAFTTPIGSSNVGGGHDLSTHIHSPRVASVDDLVDLAERRSHAKAIGLMAAMPQ